MVPIAQETTMKFQSPDYYVEVHAPPSQAANEILTPDAMRFVGLLCHVFDDRRRTLLQARKTRAVEFDAGDSPRFLQDPAVKDPNWRCASIPKDLEDRRIEITGPVE